MRISSVMCKFFYLPSLVLIFLLIYRDPLLAELKATTNPNRPLKETLVQAQNAINQFKEKQWRIKGKSGGQGVAIADIVGNAASKINQYSAILEPATQVSPFFPSVVWGAFSMFLKVQFLSPRRFLPAFSSAPYPGFPPIFRLVV